jgi:Flp pilus assembly protein TadG
MQHTNRSRRAHRGPLTRRSKRGTVMLEFALILPFFLFLVFFTVDMGRMTVLSGILSDSAYVAARSGAQRGGANINGDQNVIRTFERVQTNIPDLGADDPAQITIVNGTCSSTTGANSYIVVDVTKDVDFITPGLGALLNMAGGGDGTGGPELSTWTLSSRGTVLCEIVR